MSAGVVPPPPKAAEEKPKMSPSRLVTLRISKVLFIADSLKLVNPIFSEAILVPFIAGMAPPGESGDLSDSPSSRGQQGYGLRGRIKAINFPVSPLERRNSAPS